MSASNKKQEQDCGYYGSYDDSKPAWGIGVTVMDMVCARMIKRYEKEFEVAIKEKMREVKALFKDETHDFKCKLELLDDRLDSLERKQKKENLK